MSFNLVVHGDESSYPNVATVYALFDVPISGALTNSKEKELIDSKSNNSKNAIKKGLT